MYLNGWEPKDLVFESQYNVFGRRLFPWADVEKYCPFGGAWVVVPVNETSTPHSHDECEMFFIVEGRGTITINGESQTVKPGDSIFIPPDSTHSLTNDGPVRLLFLTIWWGGSEASQPAQTGKVEWEI